MQNQPLSPTGQPLVPVAEPGYTTTEFWLSSAAAGATLVGTVLVDFGVANLNAAQRVDITTAAVFGVSLIAGLYALARGIRKNGLI
jgi:hypothetical protein